MRGQAGTRRRGGRGRVRQGYAGGSGVRPRVVVGTRTGARARAGTLAGTRGGARAAGARAACAGARRGRAELRPAGPGGGRQPGQNADGQGTSCYHARYRYPQVRQTHGEDRPVFATHGGVCVLFVFFGGDLVTDGYEYSYPVSGELCVLPPSRSHCRLPASRARRPGGSTAQPWDVTVPSSDRFRSAGKKFTNRVTKVGAGTTPFARTFPRTFVARRCPRLGRRSWPGRVRAGEEGY